MNKSQKIKLAISAIEKSGKSYQVLNELNGMPQHIRIAGFGDVYPATGTWIGTDKKWHRKDHDGFIEAVLGRKMPKPQDKAKNTASRAKLEQRVNDLEEHVAWLEDELSKLKSNVLPLG